MPYHLAISHGRLVASATAVCVLAFLHLCFRASAEDSVELDRLMGALRRYEAAGDKARIGITLNKIGNVHESRGSYAQALEFYQKALTIAEAVGRKQWIAATLSNIGNVHKSRGSYAQALEFHQKSLALEEALGDKADIAATLINIGLVHNSRGNYAQALEFYQKGLALAEEVGDKQWIANALNNIGNVYSNQGNYAQALGFYQRSLMLKEPLGDKAGIAGTLINIGVAHELQGNYAQALEFYQNGLAIAEEVGHKEWIANALANMGNVHSSQGNYSRALEFYQRSLAIAEQIGLKGGIADALTCIGDVYSSQGDCAQALEFFQKALRIAEAIGCADTAFCCYRNIGGVAEAQGRFAEALTAYRKAIAGVESVRSQVGGGEEEQRRFLEDKVSLYHAMVGLLLAQHQPSEALGYAERAKARVLLDVLQSGRINLTKSMTPQEQDQERELNNELVSLNAQVSRENQRREPDRTLLADLTARLEKARLDYEAFRTSLYASHPQLKVQRGEMQRFTLNEARSLLPDRKTALLEFVVAEEKAYLFVLTLVKKAMGDEGSRRKGGSAAPPRASSLLSDPSSVAFQVYPLGVKQRDLVEQVVEYRKRLVHRDARLSLSARKLYDLLLKPAQRQLQGKTRLVIVPDGVLWDLPFQALQPKQGRYLTEDCAVSYAPSLTVLREMTRLRGAREYGRVGAGEYASHGGKRSLPRPQTPTPTPSQAHAPLTLLAFGNPALGKEATERVQFVLRGETLSPLPEAEREVEALRQLYGPERSVVYVGVQAREDRAKAEAGKYGLLHLATHAVLNDVSPMYSQVVLAQRPSAEAPLPLSGEGGEDGLLEAWEILNLDLHTDQVVLSACETARGRLAAGEGVIGLTWAFFVAGCPAIVVSQWKVADESTTALMVEYHRQLRSGKPKDEALRLAQLSLLHPNRRSQIADQKSFSHPFYWAPFVLVGDWR